MAGLPTHDAIWAEVHKSMTAFDIAMDLCIEAINRADENTVNQPVDPNFVAEQGEIVAAIIQSLYDNPYGGRGLGIGSVHRASWEELRPQYETRRSIGPSTLNWTNAFMVLADATNLDEEEILRRVEAIDDHPIAHNHIVRRVVSNYLALGRADAAISSINRLRPVTSGSIEEVRGRAFLLVLQHFANLGQPDAFFDHFRSAMPAKNRSEIAKCKHTLVASYAARHPLAEAIHLCERPNLGPKFLPDTLVPVVTRGGYEELKAALADKAAFDLESHEELRLLVLAYAAARRRNVPANDDFETLFDQVGRISRSLRSGDAKLKDALFFALGEASREDRDRAQRCRRAIKNRSIKRDFPLD